jgi:hypothetical protein
MIKMRRIKILKKIINKRFSCFNDKYRKKGLSDEEGELMKKILIFLYNKGDSLKVKQINRS